MGMTDRTSRIPSRRRLTLTPPPAITPIEDWGQAWEQIVRIAAAVNRVAAVAEALDGVIPEMQDDTHEAQIQSARCTVAVESLDGRLARMESAVSAPHVCVQEKPVIDLVTLLRNQAQTLSTFSNEVVAVRERLSASDTAIMHLSQNIARNAGRRRELIFYIVGVLIAFLGAVGGAIWYVAQMAKTLELEASQRQRDQVQIMERFDRLHAPVSRPTLGQIFPPRANPVDPNE